MAHRFFSRDQTPVWAALAEAPYTEGHFHPRNVGQFATLLQKIDGIDGIESLDVGDVRHLLGAMERAGLLMSGGFVPDLHIAGQIYISAGGPTSQRAHDSKLWLAKALGAELIIPLYSPVSVQVAGYVPSGDLAGGTGLVLDRTHILTNRHVIEQMEPDLQISTANPHTERNCQAQRFVHDELDIAVLKVDVPGDDPGLPTLPGMVFRDPAWADEVYLFGYPTIPGAAQTVLAVQRGEVVTLPKEFTVQRGEVVNPSTPTMSPTRSPIFLYSAIARPGNSGGPIVASDGRVVGIVFEGGFETASSEPASAPISEPFYRGIPASEISRALTDLGFPDLARMETWDWDW